METIAGNASSETVLLVRGTADVVAASNLGIGFLTACLLSVALFNTFNSGTIVDGGPPPSFWIILIANPLLCIYGLNKANK